MLLQNGHTGTFKNVDSSVCFPHKRIWRSEADQSPAMARQEKRLVVKTRYNSTCLGGKDV